MNNYLLTLVLKPDLSEKDRSSVLEDMKKKATGEDGKITKEDLWGSRDLAYPISKQTKGYYAHFELEADPKVAKDLDKALKVEEDIIRYLFVRNDKKVSKPKKVKKTDDYVMREIAKMLPANQRGYYAL